MFLNKQFIVPISHPAFLAFHREKKQKSQSQAQEDSDELRSAQSSRASTARVQSRQSRQGGQFSPPSEPGIVVPPPSDEQPPPSPPPPFQQQQQQQSRPSRIHVIHTPMGIFLERQHSAEGSSSLSSVAKVVELSTPEEEETEVEMVTGEEGREERGQQTSKKRAEELPGTGSAETSKVPRLDLGPVMVSPEPLSEPEEGQQTARVVELSSRASSVSETDTVLEHQLGGVEEEAEGKRLKVGEKEQQKPAEVSWEMNWKGNGGFSERGTWETAKLFGITLGMKWRRN